MRIKLAFMRDLLDMLSREEISFSRMVEMVNMKANQKTKLPEEAIHLLSKRDFDLTGGTKLNEGTLQ